MVYPARPDTTREYYLNADFDLSLRSQWSDDGKDARSRTTDDLGLHAVLMGGEGDSVLVPEPVPADYLDYLERRDVPVPAITVLPDVRRSGCFTPFGWNAAAASLNRRYLEPQPHPPLEVVRQVNGRRFGLMVEQEGFDGRFDLGECSSLDALQSRLRELPVCEHGWIAKAEHGNAGLGNRRIRSSHLDSGDRTVIRGILAEGDCVHLEPWQPRRLDVCATFHLSPSGDVHSFDLHEVVNTADGAFIGALFQPSSCALDPWKSSMAGAVTRVGHHLKHAGYFGPVCVDAFVWDRAGELRLRPIADVNARSHISAPYLRLWRHGGAREVIFWRFFSARKLRLPRSYQELSTGLGQDGYDPRTGRGVLLTSPLSLGEGGSRRGPRKIGVLFSGATRGHVEAAERRFRQVFER